MLRHFLKAFITPALVLVLGLIFGEPISVYSALVMLAGVVPSLIDWFWRAPHGEPPRAARARECSLPELLDHALDALGEERR